MTRFASTLLFALVAFFGQFGAALRLPAQGVAPGGAPPGIAVPRTGPLTIPAPRGLVNDFANVIPADQAAHIEAIAQAVRDRSGGEIAVVTLPDIGDRDPGDVALQIGREWKVGAAAKIGDTRRNAGTVILVVPRQTSSTGSGRVAIETGQGTEAFITDADAGAIRREATPLLAQGDYGGGIALMTRRVAEQYASAFGFNLDSLGLDLPPLQGSSGGGRRVRGGNDGGGGINPILLLIIFFVVVSVLSSLGGRGRRGCGGCIPIFLPFGGGGGGGSWGGGGWGGGGSWGGGGGGGGFGGFGGGGGFSGGGSSGSF